MGREKTKERTGVNRKIMKEGGKKSDYKKKEYKNKWIEKPRVREKMNVSQARNRE